MYTGKRLVRDLRHMSGAGIKDPLSQRCRDCKSLSASLDIGVGMYAHDTTLYKEHSNPTLWVEVK